MNLIPRWRKILGQLAILLSFASFCAAQSEPAPSANQKVDSRTPDISAKSPPTISVEQEKEILAFVSTHDVPLHGLLGNLKASRPVEYQKALADLFRATQRLSQVKRNRPHVYDLELKKWQAQSKVQLLAARLAMAPNPETRKQLRNAIEERADLDLQILRADREAAAKRLQQLDEQIAAAEATKQNRVQQQLERSLAVTRRARTSRTDALKKRPESENENPAKQEIPTAAPKK
jgi:hypothetical protein